MHKIENIFKKS